MRNVDETAARVKRMNGKVVEVTMQVLVRQCLDVSLWPGKPKDNFSTTLDRTYILQINLYMDTTIRLNWIGL